MPKSLDILGVRVDAVTKEEVEQEICRIIERKGHEYLANVNIHAINIAQRDTAFRRFLNLSPVVYCDGEGVRLAARLLGMNLPPRIVLTYWVWDLCALCAAKNFSVFLLGGSERSSKEAHRRLSERYPGLRLGFHHGYFEKIGPENDLVIEQVNGFQPDVLFVCFGMPLQEHWTERNFDRLRAKVMLFGGSTIEYTAGRKSVAPAWLSNNGGEWIYRLFQEPERLWKRYVLGNPVFLFRVLCQRFLGMRS
jgi:N-acetylglucosaminyldiphosphoundecaprenol N-acetyl-beta-D-mannosaminyltransferase